VQSGETLNLGERFDYIIIADTLNFAADVQQLALRHLRRSVELDPEYHWSRLYLANLLWQLKRVRQARVHFEAAARLRPDDGFVLSACADFLSVQSGGSERVEPRFRKAVELAPEEPAVRYQYGQHLLRTKRYGEARRELFDALPDRAGNAQLALRLNQLSRWFPRPWMWILLGLIAIAVRRPRGWPILVTLSLAAFAAVLLNAFGLFADLHFVLPVAPAFVLLGLAGLVGGRAQTVM